MCASVPDLETWNIRKRESGGLTADQSSSVPTNGQLTLLDPQCAASVRNPEKGGISIVADIIAGVGVTRLPLGHLDKR